MKHIKEIGNYYGGLWIMEFDNAYYWIIENHDTDFSDITEWTEIPKSLYDELLIQVDN
jgi:hypothetical protein